MLKDFQEKIQNILQSNMLDEIELIQIATTHGWVNACIKYNVNISQEDIDSIQEEIEAFEEYL